MESIKDYIFEGVLIIGEPCYFNHEEYIYNGFEDNKYVIKKVKQNETIVKKLDNKPFVPVLPLGLYVRKKSDGSKGEITGYTQMLDDMYYKITLYDDVFKGYDLESLSELNERWEVFSENPYKEFEEIEEELGDIDSELNNLDDQIRIINKQKEELNKKRRELTNHCKHEWYKYDEEEISNGKYEQECECNICGEKKINSYRKL